MENQYSTLSAVVLYSYCKVSVIGVVALGGHFATLCREVDFYEAIFFFIIFFQKEKANTFTLLI